MNDSTVARVAALRTAPVQDLKRMWRDFFGQDAPPFNRRFLEARLAYRIQELAHGGLRQETVKRLDRLGEQLDGGKSALRRRRVDGRPLAGTRLLREGEGVTHEVLVGVDFFEYQGRRYTSLSSVARGITGTQWNGWRFFGFQSARGLS